MSRLWNPAKNAAREEFGEDFQKLGTDSKILSSRLLPVTGRGEPITVPIYHSSVYRNKSVQHYLDIVTDGGYIYQRLGNPTTDTAEVIINELEGGKGSIVYNSGLAAINALFLNFLQQGDHIVCQHPCYSGTSDFIRRTLTKFGISVTWVPPDINAFKDALRPNTRILYAESPSNPCVTVIDLEAFGKLRSTKVITVIDGTFASPFLMQPIKYGVDISLHSWYTSKYMGGHSDLIAGCLTFRKLEHWKQMKFLLASTGSTLIKKVWYPGLKSHQQHEIANKQMKSFSGMISFEMQDLESAKCVVENVRLINLAVSLGGAESLIEHPATMTHGPMFKMQGEQPGQPDIPDGLIRFSVGLENVEDLKADLERALARECSKL